MLGKIILSQWLCISAMFNLSSCTDDEVVNQSPAAPLQVSVSTQGTMSSRAIIHDEYLPDGHSIGISLTAEDGTDYDGKQFFNLKYTASGTGDTQTWSADEPALLSTTAGKVTAYYPYNPDVTDWTKIPIETASQTDYMYAKPVTGLNIVSPSAKLTMQHALTDVRINIKKGTYTGTGAVTKITAKTPAFATAATMSAVDGSLSSVTGGGTQFETELTDAAISTADVTHDFLVVPFPGSTSGEVAIFVTIDDKKFTVNVPYTETFLQGYSYIYNLTLDNETLTFKGVNVEEWGVKAQYDETLQFYDDQYIVEIQVPSDGYTYVHNVKGFVGTIDWGDGTKSDYTTSVTYPTHNYTVAGIYIVTAEGILNQLNSTSTKVNGTNITPSKIIAKLINIGKEMKVTSMEKAFYNQNNLIKIVTGALDGCYKVTNMEYAFQGCTGLTTLPDGMFDKCTEVTSFYSTFNECTNLTNIPAGLFDNNTKVTDFTYTLSGCSKLQAIPKGLFDHCTEVISFKGAFRNCSSLQTIPEGLFDYNTKVTDFENTFGIANRAQVMKIAKIPERLFDACTEVTNFKHTFYRCTNIREIPGGLFDKCTKVTNFNYTFALTGITEIPAGLFDYCTEVTSFEETFSNCYTLTNIPKGLFDNCTEVSNFCMTFRKAAITNIPVGLFKNNTKVTDMMMTFAECISLTEIPEGLFDSFTEVTRFHGTFQECSNLEYIPMELFDACSKVTDFGSTFNGCSKLQTVPAGLFDNNTKVTNFMSTFAFTGITSIPEGLFDKCTLVSSFESAFYGCSALTSIPEGLFDHCTEVTTFYQTFYSCTALTAIPEGLFDYNTEVTDFGSTFYGCTSLTGESPYTLIDGVKVHLYERGAYPEYFTTPTSNYRAFYCCSSLTDYSTIPSEWK